MEVSAWHRCSWPSVVSFYSTSAHKQHGSLKAKERHHQTKLSIILDGHRIKICVIGMLMCVHDWYDVIMCAIGMFLCVIDMLLVCDWYIASICCYSVLLVFCTPDGLYLVVI